MLRHGYPRFAQNLKQLVDFDRVMVTSIDQSAGKSGETYWAAESIAPILGSQGEITHIVTVGEDITERKELRERLNQSQKLER